MNYYEDRKKAYEMIDKLVKEKKKDIEIIYIIQNQFGFSQAMIYNRIDLAKEIFGIENEFTNN